MDSAGVGIWRAVTGGRRGASPARPASCMIKPGHVITPDVITSGRVITPDVITPGHVITLGHVITP